MPRSKPPLSAISLQIWDMKYRLKQPDGTAVDKTIEDSFRRVARFVAEPESDPEEWAERFYDILSDFAFLPAGRIIAGAGSGRAVTLFNCFVMGTIPDDMSGIFDALREAALTMQQGGGIGYDFSTIRPKGALVHGVGADASGPLSFMDVWDAMCRTIMSAGNRRGAMMATLRCDHPDIEAFIEAKQQSGRLQMFNLSVLITDAFLKAVDADAAWPLVFDDVIHKTVSATALWDKIMRATYNSAEPGVIFIDRINDRNNLKRIETIGATNPCGEQPLPPYGTCLLGSVNLTALILEPWTDRARLDIGRLREIVALAVRFLDNVIDVSGFPLEAQRQEARQKRRIGLGITGLADALICCGLRYGSEAAVAQTRTWMAVIRESAYGASAALAREKGPFPLFDAEDFRNSESVLALGDSLQQEILETGLRNALLTSIAPTGTISLLADNISSGLEPVFAFTYRRTVRQSDGTTRDEEVSDHAYRLYRRQFGEDAPLPEAFVDVQALAPRDHLVMQAAVQGFVDSSISKTINCPAELSFEAFKTIYREAYDLGCKSCTTYRPNDITGAVLKADPQPPSSPNAALEPTEPEYLRPMTRPQILPGRTYKLRWPDSDHAIYITVNDIVEDGIRRPFEVFINSKNMEHYAWTVALTRMISAVFRRGGAVDFVVEELKAVFDPRGGHWMNGRYVPSLLAAIGGIIETHMIDIGFMAGVETVDSFYPAEGENGKREFPLEPPANGRAKCPKCGVPALIRQEGCDLCTHCGYSKCA